MLDPHELYEIAGELPELDRPVLIQAMSGFVDAGASTRLAGEHLLQSGTAQLVATFDIDQLLHYRSRRPLMDFREDHWESYEQPRIELHLLHDDEDTRYLLLTGPEPDLQWERFIAAVTLLIERLGVRLTVGLNAIPMAVPHTRPGGVIAHATRPELIAGHESWLQSVRVPASAGNLLEFRLGQTGHDALGFAVHVPHYLAESDYPGGAELLLASVSRATGLLIPTQRLRDAAEVMVAEVDAQVAQTEEALALVHGLEQQYDAYLRGKATTNLLDNAGPLPTADQLGAELERFLAERTHPGDISGA